MEETITKTRVEQIAELEVKRDEFVARLDVGAVRIEDARAKGKDVSEWENYWLQLIRQYEAVCDNLYDLYKES